MFHGPADLMGKKAPTGYLARRAALSPTALEPCPAAGISDEKAREAAQAFASFGKRGQTDFGYAQGLRQVLGVFSKPMIGECSPDTANETGEQNQAERNITGQAVGLWLPVSWLQ